MIATRTPWIFGLVLASFGLSGVTDAQILEAFGVLDNDMLDGENAGESGATASLVTDVSHGTLDLANDGSFTYQVGAGFAGTDSFVYRAEFGPVFAEATVTLSACDGGPQLFTCWDENAFSDQVEALGYWIFHEGFEEDAVWGHVRTPQSAPSVISQDIEWRSNHPDPPPMNPISTTSGPPHSGLWALYDPNHGYATGFPAECDVDNPPEHCLYHDGFTGTRVPGAEALHGVGGYFDGIYGANIGILIDGQGPFGGGPLTGPHQFFGVIDASPAGFTEFQIRELDGKIGQALYIFGDDFLLVTDTEVGVPEQEPTRFITMISPNPASKDTRIQFSLPHPAGIQLAIYDIGGRLLRSWNASQRPAGTHAIDWDLRDDAGIEVASGVYFARLATTGAAAESLNSSKVVVVH